MRASVRDEARDGVMRVPSAPRAASLTAVRMTIHPPAGALAGAAPWFRSRKLPTYVAPGWSRRSGRGPWGAVSLGWLSMVRVGGGGVPGLDPGIAAREGGGERPG